MGSSELRQLPLPVRLRDEATLANFLPSTVLEPLPVVLEALVKAQARTGEAIIYLYGPGGVGKSHLLQAACHLAGTDALYLPLAELGEFTPGEVLQDIESRALICLDDVHAVLGKADWEEALFHLYNRAQQRNCRLLVAGDAAPRALAVGLDDLRSRLGWGLVYQLSRLDDDEKAVILQFRARRRGLALPPEVARYIVSRSVRDMDILLDMLDTLDNASLAAKKPLTIPFVKRVFGW
jgi:DnaA family protein